MKGLTVIVLFIFIFASFYVSTDMVYKSNNKWPTVGISVLVRNKAHTLPYFLTCLNKLDYPKERIYIWIYSDFNEDNSLEVLRAWAKTYARDYNSVYIHTNTSSGIRHSDEYTPSRWTTKRFEHVIKLREDALNFARKKWADYIFMIDGDAFLTYPKTLKVLIKKKLFVVSPMLVSDGIYSNFWCDMSKKFYYKRADNYKVILNRDEIGCFRVPMVHSAVLMSLREIYEDLLTYNPKNVKNYKGPVDDIITFALNAKAMDIELNVCNDHPYGFLPVPLEEGEPVKEDQEQIINLKMEAISRGQPLPLDDKFTEFVSYPEPWKFKLDEIYMINLERRSERRKLMELSFKELGIKAKLVKAVDGKNLDADKLKQMSITLMPNYEDPYHKRPMKTGEIGCFLSHYNIWEEIVQKKIGISLILEDDIHFVPYFRQHFLKLLQEIYTLDWDLVYLGRKILLDGQEPKVTSRTTRPLYSYWTLGYLLTRRGAQKLLDAKPLQNMLPVDEFLPIMFDQHPNSTWKSYFPRRDLKALSAAPLLLHPTHYTGQKGYISDTEDSNVVDMENNLPYKVEL